MPYVMVPVPGGASRRGHAVHPARDLPRPRSSRGTPTSIASSSSTRWTRPRRSLLAFVARASADGDGLADAEAARQVSRLSVRETLGIANELNTLTRRANRPALITVRTVTERLPNGRITEKRVLLDGSRHRRTRARGRAGRAG